MLEIIISAYILSHRWDRHVYTISTASTVQRGSWTRFSGFVHVHLEQYIRVNLVHPIAVIRMLAGIYVRVNPEPMISLFNRTVQMA